MNESFLMVMYSRPCAGLLRFIAALKMYWPLLTTVLEMLKACYKMLPNDLFELEI